MPRDHKKLKVFHLADDMVLEVYKITKKFPREEMFGLSSQMRRAAVSAPANIVEGCARHTRKDFAHFLNIALGSIFELNYYVELSLRLKYISEKEFDELNDSCVQAGKALNAFITTIRKP